jgi:hypothetical protein
MFFPVPNIQQVEKEKKFKAKCLPFAQEEFH